MACPGQKVPSLPGRMGWEGKAGIPSLSRCPEARQGANLLQERGHGHGLRRGQRTHCSLRGSLLMLLPGAGAAPVPRGLEGELCKYSRLKTGTVSAGLYLMQMFPMFCSIVLLINKNQPKTKKAFGVICVSETKQLWAPICRDCPGTGGLQGPQPVPASPGNPPGQRPSPMETEGTSKRP